MLQEKLSFPNGKLLRLEAAPLKPTAFKLINKYY